MLENVLKYGVGGINIDECRISHNEPIKTTNRKGLKNYGDFNWNYDTTKNHIASASPKGRFPANTILTYDDTDYDEVCGGFPYTKNSKRSSNNNKNTVSTNTYTPPKAIYTDDNTYGDEGSASRYFYCAKAGKKDRDEGLEEFKEYEVELIGQLPDGFVSSYGNIRNKPLPKRNTHPTVKPTELMQYLVRLVSPKHSTILDPFMGSGSTGKAVAYENNERNMDYKFIGVELDNTYMNIAKARILYADGSKISIETNVEDNTEEVVVIKKPKQQRLF